MACPWTLAKFKTSFYGRNLRATMKSKDFLDFAIFIGDLLKTTLASPYP
jgi:hypothetical protein